MVTSKHVGWRNDVEESRRHSFEEFFAAEYPRLVRAAYLLTGSLPEAEELAQEAMTRLLERWDTVREMDNPVAYAYRVTLNLGRRRWRRLRRQLPLSSRRDVPSENPSDGITDRLALISALQSLPTQQREALILTSWLEFSSEESARIVRVRAGTFRVRTHRARAALRQALEEDHDG